MVDTSIRATVFREHARQERKVRTCMADARSRNAEGREKQILVVGPSPPSASQAAAVGIIPSRDASARGFKSAADCALFISSRLRFIAMAAAAPPGILADCSVHRARSRVESRPPRPQEKAADPGGPRVNKCTARSSRSDGQSDGLARVSRPQTTRASTPTPSAHNTQAHDD